MGCSNGVTEKTHHSEASNTSWPRAYTIAGMQIEKLDKLSLKLNKNDNYEFRPTLGQIDSLLTFHEQRIEALKALKKKAENAAES